MDCRGAVIPDRSAEPGGGHIEGASHPQVKKELGGTKMELDAKKKGKTVTSIKKLS